MYTTPERVHNSHVILFDVEFRVRINGQRSKTWSVILLHCRAQVSRDTVASFLASILAGIIINICGGRYDAAASKQNRSR